MRRQDRAIVSMDEIVDMLKATQVCRLAFHGEEYPYIVPMHFGFAREGDALALYFHCAPEGERMRRMRRDGRVAFEMEGPYAIVGLESACSYTTHYESVMGTGTLREVQGEEKRLGIQALMRQIAPGRTFALDAQALENVAVLRLDVISIAGKANRAAR